jgi:serine phosphatase RsbU (regulator of sigma subunit)
MAHLETLAAPLSIGDRRDGADPVAPTSPSERMECMQVWGGNTVAETAVSTSGLDVWLYCKPYGDGVHGGDIYSLSSCSSGRITRLALADVRGHGETVLALAGSLRRLMRRHIDHINQGALVEAINRELAAMGDTNTFATGLVATFFVPTRTLSLTNAGHPAPLLFSASRREWRALEHESTAAPLTNVPLGMFESASYTQLGVKMSTNDLLLCYTDGLEECVDHAGETMGRHGLARIAAGTNPDEPSTVIPEILRRLTSMSADNLSGDDVTVMLIRANGASIPLRDNLLAPFRYLRNLIRTR